MRPEAEVEVTVELARRLVDEQLASVDPVAAAAALTPVAGGWDNEVFRLGPRLALRIPRRAVGAELLANEARWSAIVAEPVRVATSAPVFLGRPTAGFPWPWLVVPWIEGEDVADLPVGDRSGIVDDLADALVAIHRPAPPDAPHNPFRGVSVESRRTEVAARIDAWDGPREPLRRAWDRACAADPYAGPPLWLHGDPHPLNLLHRGGRLAGIIDFGDVTAGDPASDLATAWWTFGPADRSRFIARLRRGGPYDEAIWARAAGWALMFASAIPPGTPLYPTARHTAEQLVADFG